MSTMVSEQKVALVTGGFGYIGLAIVEALLRRNFRVVVFYHQTDPQVVRQWQEEQGAEQAAAIRIDITDEAAVSEAINQAFTVWGRLDVCVHAAEAPIIRKKVSELESAQLRWAFEVGFFGGAQVFRAVLEIFQKQGAGHLIALSSEVTEPGVHAGRVGGYAVAKQALRALMRELAYEFKSSSIRINVVEPDFLPGGLNRDLPPRLLELLQQRQSSVRLTEPSDVALAVAYLCSEASDEITGRVIRVVGGKTLSQTDAI